MLCRVTCGKVLWHPTLLCAGRRGSRGFSAHVAAGAKARWPGKADHKAEGIQ